MLRGKPLLFINIRMSFFKKWFSKEKNEDLEKGIEKTKDSFLDKISKAVAGKSKVDIEFLDQLEDILIASDVGLETTVKIINRLETRVQKDKYLNTAELNQILKEEINEILIEKYLAGEELSNDESQGSIYL